MIDTHAHIYLNDFEQDIETIIQNAQNVGVNQIFMPNIDSKTIARMYAVEQKYPTICYAMMGLHPCYVKENFEEELNIVAQHLVNRKFVAIGEIGTDLYWDTTFFEQQKEAFRFQVKLAQQYDLPIIIHCRNSIPETIALVKECYFEGLRGVFHCFSGNLQEAEEIISLNFYLGIGGVATFKNGGLDKVLPYISLEKLVLETDSPYLAPIPHRGKRNEPAYIPLIAQKIADLKQITIQEVATVTTQNAQVLFNI